MDKVSKFSDPSSLSELSALYLFSLKPHITHTPFFLARFHFLTVFWYDVITLKSLLIQLLTLAWQSHLLSKDHRWPSSSEKPSQVSISLSSSLVPSWYSLHILMHYGTCCIILESTHPASSTGSVIAISLLANGLWPWPPQQVLGLSPDCMALNVLAFTFLCIPPLD